ncbi:MAG: M48 family metalloprotease [Verrucomicrobiota bacterium]
MEVPLLRYHQDIIQFLKKQEPELWAFYAKAEKERDYLEVLKKDLLKNTYRLGEEDHTQVYQCARFGMKHFDLDLPLVIYQTRGSGESNAAIYFHEEEIHILFTGETLKLLSEEELKAVFAHEITHYKMYSDHNRELQVASEILRAMVSDATAQPSYFETARRFQLYLEIACDRGALDAVKNQESCISSLVKVETGLTEVSSASYLKQTEEILSMEKSVISKKDTHPEAFIRAKALSLWGEHDGAEIEIEKMISGKADLEKLDLNDQQYMSQKTKELFDHILSEKWFRTDVTLSHARQYIQGYQWKQPKQNWELQHNFEQESIYKYFSFVILDFLTVDRDLDDKPLPEGLKLAKKFGFDSIFKKIAMKELKLKARQWKIVEQQAGQAG